MDEKGEGAAGSVLGGGSSLRREGVPGTRKEAHVIERRQGSSWSEDREERCLVGSSSGREEMELRVGKTPGGNLLCSCGWLTSQGRNLRLVERYR